MFKSKKSRNILIILFALILLLNPCISSIGVYATNTNVEEIVEFNDSELERQLVQGYDTSGDGKMSKSEMEAINYLIVNYGDGTSVNDLIGLEYAINLEELNIYSEQITDITVIGNLTNLNKLTLFGNKVTDISAIKKLTNLQSLELSVNKDCETTVLENLINLIELTISNSTSVSTDTLAKLTKLETLNLDIYGSQISDISKLESLTSLKQLSLQNGVTDANAMDTVSKLKSLVYLNLSMSNLNGLDKISTLTNLQNLQLYLEEATEIDLSIVQNLSKLNQLRITGNNQVLELKNLNTLEKLSKLTELSLNRANLDSIEFIENMISLDYLDLSNNKIEDLTKLKGLTNLTQLSLNNNKITELTGLETLTNLYYLSLTGNLIDDEEENNAKVLEKLRKNNAYISINIDEFDRTEIVKFNDEVLKNQLVSNYDLNDDEEISKLEMEEIYYLEVWWGNDNPDIADLTGLEHAKNLQKLSIYSNRITDIAPIKNLTRLEDLYICSNSLENIKVIENLTTNLTKFGFNNNKITDISAIGKLVNLEELTISSNSIKDISIISDLKQLKILNIDSCSLNSIDIIGQCKSLEELQLNLSEDLLIEDISSLNTLENLKFFSAGQGIDDSNILDTVGKFKNLTHLDIWDPRGNIKSLDKIADLTKIENMSLGLSGTAEIDLVALKNMIQLKYLEIYNVDAGRNITLTNLNALDNARKLVSLDFSGLNIENIEFVKNLTNLNDLNLSDNKIPNITPLGNLTNLYELNLYNNKITDLTGLEKLVNLRYLYLGNNLINDKEENNAKVLEILRQNNVEISIDEFDDSKIIELDESIKEYLIQYGYDANGDNEISTKEIQNAYEIRTYNSPVKSLAGLEYATNLQSLNIEIDSTLDFSQLKSLTKLTSLNVYSWNYSNGIDISSIGELSQLQELTININSGEKLDMKFITKLSDLRKFSMYDGNTNIDLNLLNSLTKLEELEIQDRNCNDEESLNLPNLKKLYLGYMLNNTKLNIDVIDNLTNLEELEIYNLGNDLIGLEKLEKLKKLKLTTYNQKLDYENMLSKLTNIETLEIRGIFDELSYLTQLGDLKELTLYNESPDTFDIESLQKLTNLESLSLLGNLNDINGIEKLEKLNYLALTHSARLNDMYGTIIDLEEEKFIETIEKIKIDNLNIDGEFNTDYIIVNEGETVQIAYEDISPLMKAIMNPNSKLYNENMSFYFYNYNEYPIEVDNENKVISITGDGFGEKNYSMSIQNTFGQAIVEGYINLRWRNIVKGDSTKEIEIPDINLKNTLLEKYDIDEDNRITEHDMINLESIDIKNKNVQNIKGLEYATNMKYLDLSNNQIVDLSPLSKLTELKYVYLTNNKVKDISTIKDFLSRDFDYEENYFEMHLTGNEIQDLTGLDEIDFRRVDLSRNYIDFSEGSTNRQVVENGIRKHMHEEYISDPYIHEYMTEEEYVQYKLDWIKGYYVKQKYGTPAERNDVLELEEALKNRLIELGLDTNNDSKLTKGELNDFGSNIYSELDLSNLGITNIDNLKYLSQIWTLDLSGNNITDISPLKECKMIRKLNLNNNNISSIACIKEFHEIKELYLSNNKITDISAIEELESAHRSYIYFGMFGGSGGGVNRSFTIDLSYNNIQNISVIAKLRTLISADLSHNKISDINCLKDYNFAVEDITEGDEEYIEEFECLGEFKGINLSYNKIDTTLEINKVSIDVFKNKGVTLNLENQDLTASTVQKGDVNGDEKITLADYTKILAQVKKTSELEGDALEAADVNGDGKVSLADYTKVLAHVKKTSMLP